MFLCSISISMAALSEPPEHETLDTEVGNYNRKAYDPLAYIHSTINIELYSEEFREYKDQVKPQITRGEMYEGTCTFIEPPEIPGDIKEKINRMVQQVITDLNQELIDQKEEESKEASIKGPLSETYDVVILLQTHGRYDDPTKCVEETLPETSYEKYVSFLEAVPCGVLNLTLPNWHETTLEKYERYKDDYGGSNKDLAFMLQYALRSDKIAQLHLKNSSYNKFLVPNLNGTKEQKEMARAFIRVPGWNLITSSSSYANRFYEREPNWPFSIVIIDCKKKDYIGMQLHQRIPAKDLNRKGLLDYLFSQGFTHPLIIDNSCGVVYGTPTEVRGVSRMFRDAKLTGGTRKRKSTRKRKQKKSIKRPKV